MPKDKYLTLENLEAQIRNYDYFSASDMRGLTIYKILLATALVLNMAQGYAQMGSEADLITAYEGEKSTERKFLRLLRLGEYYQKNDLAKADSLRIELLRQSRVFNDSLRFAALVYSANVNLLNGRTEAYYKDVLSTQSFLNRLKSDAVQFEVYRFLGDYHSTHNEYQTATFYLNYAKRIALKENQKDKLASVYRLMAINQMHAEQKDSALYYADLAIRIGRRSTQKEILISCFHTQARVMNHFGQIEISIAKNILARQMAVALNDRYMISLLSREIGVTQEEIGNIDDAETYFRSAYDNAVRINDYRQKALSLSSLGTVNFKRKNYTKAITQNEEALKILENYSDMRGMGEAHNNLGLIYQQQRDFAKAANHFNQSLVYFESAGDKDRIAAVYHNVGSVFQQQKKYDKALNYLNRSLAISENNISQKVLTYRTMSNVYSDLGQKNKALEYLQLYINYVDSNSTLQSTAKIAELSELYRSEQQERLILSQADSIERQRQEKALTASKLENVQLRNSLQLYILSGFLIIVVLAGVILFYRWNQSKILQQQRETEMAQTLLRAQMNPHFVFNAMSVIQSYIYDNDTVNSTKFLVNFSRLMRLILENSSKETISIITEQEILQKYLETQKLRFEDRFDFDIDIEEELIQEMALIPPMITQPFIENSIEHGQLHTIEGGFIHITFRKKDEMLHITIEDNGIGRKGAELSKKSQEHKSMAMSITSERIENLNKKYKTDGYLHIEDYDKTKETVTKVLISLPYRTENHSN